MLRINEEFVKLIRASALRCGLIAVSILCIIAFAPTSSKGSEFNEFPVVKKIEILGNKVFSDRKLKSLMRLKELHFYNIFNKPRYRKDFLRRDVETIESFYRKNGFFDAHVKIASAKKSKDAKSVIVKLMVIEGPQTIVDRVTFHNNRLFSTSYLSKGLRLLRGRPYNPNLLEVDRYTIFSKYLEKGYLNASIRYKVTRDSTRVAISWYVDSGMPMVINNTYVSGNVGVKKKIIVRELTFKKGEVFNLKKVLASKQNLYDTGCFNSVEIEPESLDVKRRLVDLRVSVSERKAHSLEAGFGIGNIHGNRIFAELGMRNVFGEGLTFNMKSSYAFSVFRDNKFNINRMDYRSKFASHEGELRIPHIFSTWNTLTIGGYYERDATIEPAIVKSLSFRTTLSRRFSRQTSLFIGYGLERVERLQSEDLDKESRKHFVTLSFTRDKRDNYFNPRKGYYLTFEGRVSGGILGGEDNSYSVVSAFQRYKKINRTTVFAYRVRTGYADVFSESKSVGLPIESRFFAGGGNSVRGFKENSLGALNESGKAVGGRVLLLTNLELRFPMPLFAKYNFGGALFVDGGNVWGSFGEIKLKDFRFAAAEDQITCNDYMYSTGFGIRYYTPVGPIRFDIGFPIKKQKGMDYSYWLHISLGQIF